MREPLKRYRLPTGNSCTGGVMTAVVPEHISDDEFADLDRLEMIESSELKLSGAYHSYIYYAEENTDDLAGKA
jgi:hypothetical protein